MCFRFFRRVRIAPGLSLNFRNRRASLPVGGRGARMTFGTTGVTSTVGIPGTGLFFTEHSGWKLKQNKARIRHSVFRSDVGGIPKAEAIRQLVIKNPSFGGTLGQRENDELVREVAIAGGKRMRLKAAEARALLERVKADSRFRLADENGRTMSMSQFEAKIRRIELLDKMEENQKQIEHEQNEYEDLLNMWRDLPPVPAPEEINSALQLRQLKSDSQPPSPPDFEAEKRALIASIQTDLVSRFPHCVLPRFAARRKARKLADDQWTRRRSEIESSYKKTVEDYETKLDRAKTAWPQQEKTRIAKLQKIIDGDVVEMHNTAVQVIQSIKFAFDTACDIYLDDSRNIYVDLDLPEIEDVIPTHKKKALKNGRISEFGIAQINRNRDYFELVVGQGIFIAAHLFANLPTLMSVTVAGYTQRQRKRASDEIDSYVFEIGFPKTFLAGFDADVEDIRPLLRPLSAIMSVSSNWKLEQIDRPAWVRRQYKDQFS